MNENDNKKKESNEGTYLALGMTFGMLIGGFVGRKFFNDGTEGAFMGMCVGMFIGSLIKKK